MTADEGKSEDSLSDFTERARRDSTRVSPGAPQGTKSALSLAFCVLVCATRTCNERIKSEYRQHAGLYFSRRIKLTTASKRSGRSWADTPLSHMEDN